MQIDVNYPSGPARWVEAREIGGENWVRASEVIALRDTLFAAECKLAAFQYPPEHRVSVAERERDEALRRLDRLLDRVREMKYEPHKLQELIDSFGVVERLSPIDSAALAESLADPPAPNAALRAAAKAWMAVKEHAQRRDPLGYQAYLSESMDDKDYRVRVRIKADIDWRMPPKNNEEAMLRDQASTKLQALASSLERGVEQLLTDLAPRTR
jgi:hypothetical protein